MANNIALAEEYTKALDAKYRFSSLTSSLEVKDEMTRGFDEAGTVQIQSIVTSGLGNYDRASRSAFPNGSTTLTWESFTIDNDRAQSFQVDSMDNAEARKSAFVNTASVFMDDEVIPEIDSIRFTKIAAKAKTTVTGTLTSADALQAFDQAMKQLDDDEVPMENRVVYMSTEMYYAIKDSTRITRNMDVDANGNKMINTLITSIDGVPIVKVPASRFNTAITLNDGTGDVWGYTQTGVDINFMLVHKTAVKAVTRHQKVRIFGADTNQQADADLYQYRVYHDLLVPANKTAGIYAHTKTV